MKQRGLRKFPDLPGWQSRDVNAGLSGFRTSALTAMPNSACHLVGTQQILLALSFLKAAPVEQANALL